MATREEGRIYGIRRWGTWKRKERETRGNIKKRKRTGLSKNKDVAISAFCGGHDKTGWRNILCRDSEEGEVKDTAAARDGDYQSENKRDPEWGDHH